MAIVEIGSGIGDPDHGLVQHLARIAHGLREGAAQVASEIAVALIGEALVNASGTVGHASIWSQYFRSCFNLVPIFKGAADRPRQIITGFRELIGTKSQSAQRADMASTNTLERF